MQHGTLPQRSLPCMLTVHSIVRWWQERHRKALRESKVLRYVGNVPHFRTLAGTAALEAQPDEELIC